jgi:hypothetical protein
MLGSVSEITDEGVASARAKIAMPGQPQSGNQNVAITTVDASEGYEGVAWTEGQSTASASLDDGYGNDATSHGSVHIASSSDVDDYGQEMTFSNLDALTMSAQNGEGQADAGAAGYARGTVNDGTTESYSTLQAAISRSRPRFAEAGYRGEKPRIHSTTNTPGSYSTAYLDLHQSACADSHEEDCNP